MTEPEVGRYTSCLNTHAALRLQSQRTGNCQSLPILSTSLRHLQALGLISKEWAESKHCWECFWRKPVMGLFRSEEAVEDQLRHVSELISDELSCGLWLTVWSFCSGLSTLPPGAEGCREPSLVVGSLARGQYVCVSWACWVWKHSWESTLLEQSLCVSLPHSESLPVCGSAWSSWEVSCLLTGLGVTVAVGRSLLVWLSFVILNLEGKKTCGARDQTVSSARPHSTTSAVWCCFKRSF